MSSARRGEIWTANLGSPPTRHWVLIVSLDERNLSDRRDSVLIVPFSSRGPEGATVIELPPGETGLPGPSFVKGHFMQVLSKRPVQSGTANPLGQTHARNRARHPPQLRSGCPVAGQIESRQSAL